MMERIRRRVIPRGQAVETKGVLQTSVISASPAKKPKAGSVRGSLSPRLPQGRPHTEGPARRGQRFAWRPQAPDW